MNISHSLITLGLVPCLLSGEPAFGRPTPHFENGSLSHQKRTITSHVPTAKTSGAPGYAHRRFLA
jgi:hypothetical protein